MALATIFPSTRPQLFTWLATAPALPTAADLSIDFIMQGAVLLTYNAGPPITIAAEYIYVNSTVGWQPVSMPAVAAAVTGNVDVDSLPGTVETDIAAIKAAVEGATPTGTNNIGDVDIASIAAGETHVGEVGANTTLVSISPVVTAGAYHANDIVGGTGAGAGLGINTLASAVRVSGGTGIIQSLVISDLAAQNAAFEIYLFSANPAAGTYTDNGALDIHDTDALLCIGRIDVSASDYKSLADNSIACVRSIGLPIKVAATSLFVIIRTTGTPTYVGTSDLKLTFGILRD